MPMVYVDEAPLTHKVLSFLSVEEIEQGIKYYNNQRERWITDKVVISNDTKR